MKSNRVIAAFAAASMVISGCGMGEQQYGGTELILELPAARVEVLSHQLTAAPVPSLTINMDVVNVDGEQTRRTLKLRKSVDDLRTGVEAIWCSESGKVIVSALQRWGMTEDGVALYYMKEATSADSLELEAEVRGQLIQEAYKLNGTEFASEYERDSPNMELARSRFENYYAGQSTLRKLTLAENSEGELMMAITTNDAFLAWAMQETSPLRDDLSRSAKIACDADCVCGIASLCAFAKCFAGGIANFMCVACTGTSLACGIAALF